MSETGFPIGPDPERVILLPFTPGVEVIVSGHQRDARTNAIMGRILSLGPEETERQLADILGAFEGRHRDLVRQFEERAARLGHAELTFDQRRLAGAYFTMEYAFQSTALFNPSMVMHPDQSGAPDGGLRFIVGLRAVGEGHISSLTFRSGTIDRAGDVVLDPATRLACLPRETSRRSQDGIDVVTFGFDPHHDLSERVIHPMTEAQRNGVEDARFVAFEDAGERRYYATYTAYSGHGIRSELLETTDFTDFTMTTLQGASARNKGMALFPRKVRGRYAMISREDAENLYLVTSDDLYRWEGGTVLMEPMFPWELVQIGNCGSPIELDEGWLLFIHGVGPVRNYAIGALLLDKDDPSRVIARSREPLLRPKANERGGYVPNVVYSCGGVRHGERIILPYGVSDRTSDVTSFGISEMLGTLEPA